MEFKLCMGVKYMDNVMHKLLWFPLGCAWGSNLMGFRSAADRDKNLNVARLSPGEPFDFEWDSREIFDNVHGDNLR